MHTHELNHVFSLLGNNQTELRVAWNDGGELNAKAVTVLEDLSDILVVAQDTVHHRWHRSEWFLVFQLWAPETLWPKFHEPIRNTLLSWLFCVWRVCSVGQMGLHWFGYGVAAGLGLREFVGWYGGLSFMVAAIGRFGWHGGCVGWFWKG
jgi:hypothetical protein